MLFVEAGIKVFEAASNKWTRKCEVACLLKEVLKKRRRMKKKKIWVGRRRELCLAILECCTSFSALQCITHSLDCCTL
jgi:hypothetical protein